ncbi:unnamed protein product, partial [Didymodactylos carnosus]
RIRPIVGMIKNDLIEQELKKYSNRTLLSRCCQTCTPKSFTNYKWIDSFICDDKDLFQFYVAGKLVSPLFYFWRKDLSAVLDYKQENMTLTSQIREYKKNTQRKDISTFTAIINADEPRASSHWNIQSVFPQVIFHLYEKLLLYYSYRKAYSQLKSVNINTQEMKSLKLLFK